MIKIQILSMINLIRRFDKKNFWAFFKIFLKIMVFRFRFLFKIIQTIKKLLQKTTQSSFESFSTGNLELALLVQITTKTAVARFT